MLSQHKAGEKPRVGPEKRSHWLGIITSFYGGGMGH